MRTPEEQTAYIAHLESEIVKFQAKVKELEVEIARLKKEKGLTREDLTFNQHTGLYADQSGQLYCTKCLDNEKRNPVKNEAHGWRCMVCNKYYADPNRPVPRLAGGSGDWMA